MGTTPFVLQHLRHQRKRSISAVSGITFACILIFLQLGFLDAVLMTATHLYSRLDFDLVISSRDALESTMPYTFNRVQIDRLRAIDGVARVAPLDIGYKQWKNPINGRNRALLVLGIDPDNNLTQFDSLSGDLSLLNHPETIFVDTKSRNDYGFKFFLNHSDHWAQVGNRREKVSGSFELGPSLRYDGSILTGGQNFRRIFGSYSTDITSVGLLKLQPNSNIHMIKEKIESILPDKLLILTKDQVIERDKRYWLVSTSIGYVFGIGACMGLLVGIVIVGQIMNADVSTHLSIYATLLAIGYPKLRVMSLIIRLGLVVSVLAILPSLAGAKVLYSLTNLATGLPMQLTLQRVITVSLLSLIMGGGSAYLSARRVMRADPALLFS
ncbi:possible membrane permease or ABC transporter component [Prochlorococcus marinus str. MIT 9313]|uniref:Possible membrane permease or ABC transporter component n=1 Tax=Prochlorococcus marinus (strain MIT 9313) TaxID=74547 RepID=Q7V5I6_PROMM|nr:possible membrane permease or ABC transporter component [Prochlorococcus marinus str. MIT 9313]